VVAPGAGDVVEPVEAVGDVAIVRQNRE
jgi:hypothetical protein